MTIIPATVVILKQAYDKKTMPKKAYQAKLDKKTSPQRTTPVLIAGFALVGFVWLI